jgi:hypothetical protein
MLRLVPVGAAALALAAAGTAAAPPSLGVPADLLPRPGGKFLVTDRARGAVLLVDPARKSARPVSRATEARELAVVGGRVLVTSRERILARVSSPGSIALDARGRIVGVTLGGTIFRIEGSRARTIYP